MSKKINDGHIISAKDISQENINKNHNFSKYIDLFIHKIRSEFAASSNTAEAYSNDIEHFLYYLYDSNINNIAYFKIKKNCNIKDSVEFCPQSIKTSTINQYIANLHELGYARSSIARKISSLKGFFALLLEDGEINDNPMAKIKQPKIPKSIPKALNHQTILKLLQNINTDYKFENELDLLNESRDIKNKNNLDHDITSFESYRDKVILEVLYSTGMRISEILSLNIDDLSWRSSEKNDVESQIIISGKGGKERIVILHERARAHLNKYIELRKQFIKKIENNAITNSKTRYKNEKYNHLFIIYTKTKGIRQMSRQYYYIKLQNMANQLGIPKNFISPHKIRHTFATDMLKGGADLRSLQTMLGHSSINSTEIYTKVQNDELHDAINNYHPIKLSTENKI